MIVKSLTGKYRLACAFFILISFLQLSAQQFDPVTFLNTRVAESSGLNFVHERLISHNDSDGKPELFELDSISGEVLRTVFLKNASNVDWEAVCSDDHYMYIGDFGNNYGARTDLRVYRLSLDDYLTGDTDTLMVDTIRFSYSDQTDFTPKPYASNYDAETLLAFSDSLWIFTKNWKDAKCNIYKVAKTPGDQVAYLRDSINPYGLITDATYNTTSQKILLCGYTDEYPLMVEIDEFTKTPLSLKPVSRTQLGVFDGYSAKIEGIAATGTDNYLVTSEKSTTGKASLFRLRFSDKNSIIHVTNGKNEVIYDPVQKMLFTIYNEPVEISVYEITGKICIRNGRSPLDISALPSGIYIVRLKWQGHIVGLRKIYVLS
ncbi:hypothetical protein ACE01N_04530 [Saccharicrinis sp. FJH2]|uniref:T9SS type A sorting domain-containing protein n=1 Tax=Saccharicrinis sp. FJH65 TaxID=3344659 RepID=UPI0035F41112